MSLLDECLLPNMFLVLTSELNDSYMHQIFMYSILYFQLKKYIFLCCNNHMDQKTKRQRHTVERSKNLTEISGM